MAIIYPNIATGDFASTKTANNFSGSQTITGSLNVSGAISSSQYIGLPVGGGASLQSAYDSGSQITLTNGNNFVINPPPSGISDINIAASNILISSSAASSPVVIKTNNATNTITNGLVIGAKNYVNGGNLGPALGFTSVGNNYGTYDNWGTIFTSQTTGWSILAGLNFHAGQGYGYGGFNFLGGDPFSSPITPGAGEQYAIINTHGAGNGGFVKSFAANGYDAYRVQNNGARYKIGTGTDDYLYSDGTRIGTPGDFYASGTISGSTGLFTTITASAISASEYIGIANGLTAGEVSASFARLIGDNNFSGSQTITGSITNSGSLSIFGSGSAAPLFHIQGSQGQLFSVIDSLTGSLFSVNDISGLPILEVFSDNTILQGSFSSPSLNTTVRNILSTTGSFVVYAIPTASYDAGFFDYVARSGSNARAGQIMTLWSGSSVNFTETSTTDFGNTSGLTFGSYISGSSMVLTGSATTSGWTIKTIVRSI